MEEIYKRFIIKVHAENKEIVYLFNGEIIKDENKNISQLSSEKVTILTFESNDVPVNDKNLIKSNYVICPKCKGSIILEEKDYKLIIFGCKNEYITKNILFFYISKIKIIVKLNLSNIIF